MPWVDGIETMKCPVCNGRGEDLCPTCGQVVGECETCDGAGEIPKTTAKVKRG